MPRYVQGQLDWHQLWQDLQSYQDSHQLTNAALAKQLHISQAALTRYYKGERQPGSDVFAFVILMMGRELRDYVKEFPYVA